MSHRIEICLGSSCYAKGAERLVQVATAWARTRGGQVLVAGHRCANRCGHGPRVAVDGIDHVVADAAALTALLARLEQP